MLRLPFLCLVATLVAACSTPYNPPDVIGVKEFPGAMALANNEGRVRVVMSHGMCSGVHKHFGKNNWVAQRAGLIARTIGDEGFEPTSYEPTREYPDQAGTPSAVQRVDMEMSGDEGTIYDISFLLWGDPFDAAREGIADVQIEDSSGQPPRRATFNGKLKDILMNECFVDAVAYTGERGDVVRRNMRVAMCDLMGGRVIGPNLGRPTEIVKCSGISGRSQTPVMLVPESLGAKVLMDAFLALDDGRGGARKATAIGPIKAIHLATHQLPLLNTALVPANKTATARDAKEYQLANRAIARSADAAPDTPLNDFLQVLGGTGLARLSADPISLVVYYDPNDIFGYPLDPSSLSPRLNVDLTNVIVSNATTYAGLAANPLKAHRNTARPEISEIIIKGSEALKN